jgi:hypothetical protein
MPWSPFELARLVEIATCEVSSSEEDVGEACLMLVALWRMTCLIRPPLRTRVMHKLRTVERYATVRKGTSLRVPRALVGWRPEVPAALWLNVDAKKGATWENRLCPPQAHVWYSHNLESNVQMQLYWARPGIPNSHHGVIIHANLSVHLQGAFTMALMSMLECWTLTAQDRRRFQNTLCEAVLAGGYESYITQKQMEYPDAMWTPLITTHPFPLHRSSMTSTTNLSTDHIYALFFINQIPILWVETMYAPCLYLLRNQPMTGINLEALDLSCIQYINLLGRFPVGEEQFNHWVAPTDDDQIHLSNLMMGDHNSPAVWSQFVQLGADVDHRILISSRPAPTFEFESNPGSVAQLDLDVSSLSMNALSGDPTSHEPPTGLIEDMNVDDTPSTRTDPVAIPLPASPQLEWLEESSYPSMTELTKDSDSSHLIILKAILWRNYRICKWILDPETILKNTINDVPFLISIEMSSAHDPIPS